MATTIPESGRRVALDDIRVPENVRALDDAHVQALAGSLKLQGMLVPVVVRDDGDGFELVAGFHRIAAARLLGLADVPVVVRDVDTEDADRAVENITSCRHRHDVIYADRVVMPMSELKCPTARCEPGGEVGMRTRTDPGSQAAADGLAEVGAAARLRKAARDRHPATRSRFVLGDSVRARCRRYRSAPVAIVGALVRAAIAFARDGYAASRVREHGAGYRACLDVAGGHCGPTCAWTGRLPVCVVGAGGAGLAAAQALKARDVPFVVYEAGSGIGGNWRYENDSGLCSAYASLTTNVSRQLTSYRCCPLRRGPLYLHHSEMLAYLEAFTDRFGLREHIRLGSPISSVRALDDDGWDVRAGDGGPERYRAVLVATGYNSVPRYPDLPGRFDGLEIHSHDYRTPEPFAGRDTVVIGLG